LFVSHDISTVRSICSRALWLKNGHAERWGDAKDVAKEYEKFCWQEQGVVLQNSETISESSATTVSAGVNGPETGVNTDHSFPRQLFQSNPVFEKNRERSRIGTGDVIVKNFIMLNEDGDQITSCEYNEQIALYYLLEVCNPVTSDFVLGLRLRDLKGNFIYSANDIDTVHRIEAAPGDRVVVSTRLRIPLSHQDYVLLTGVFGFIDGRAFNNGVYDFSKSVIWDVIEDAAYLKVHPCKVMPMAGPVSASFDLTVKKIESYAKFSGN
jgi:lipopolysaccharide transport system ATP-binding protein